MDLQELTINELESIYVSYLIVELCPKTLLLPSSKIDEVKALAGLITEQRIEDSSLSIEQKEEAKVRQRAWADTFVRNLKCTLRSRGMLIE